MMRRAVLACALLLLLVSACAGEATSAPETQETPTSTATPRTNAMGTPMVPPTADPNRPTLTPSPTRMPRPTRTPSPTPTIAPTPLSAIVPPAGIQFRTTEGLFVTDGAGNHSLFLAFEEGEFASLSPDGNFILHFKANEEYVTTRDGGQRMDVLPREGYNLCPFSWIPGQPAYLMGTLLDADSSPGYSCERGTPVLLSVDGNMAILEGEGHGGSRPQASPDGQFIAYDIAGVPWLYEWQRGSRPFEVGQYGFPLQEEILFFQPIWSPDGERLAWLYFSKARDQATGMPARQEIAVFDLDANTVNLFSPYLILNYEGSWPGISWNASGTYITFPQGTPSNFNYQLLSIDGTISRALDGTALHWSPDGNLYAILKREEDAGLSQFFIESPDGTVSFPLCCENPWAADANWNPGSDQVIVSVLERDGMVHYLNDLATGAVWRLELPLDAEVVGWEAGE